MFAKLELLFEDHVKQDQLFSDSFGFTYDSFSQGFQRVSEDHVAYGLRAYVEERRASGIPMLPDFTLSLDEADGAVYPNPSSSGIFTIKSTVFDLDQLQVWSSDGRSLPVRILSKSSESIICSRINILCSVIDLHNMS